MEELKLKRSALNQRIAERVQRLPAAEIRRLANSTAARQKLAAETKMIFNQDRKETK
jgi:hypothetical protein